MSRAIRPQLLACCALEQIPLHHGLNSANLAEQSSSRLTVGAKARLKRIQYRHGPLDGLPRQHQTRPRTLCNYHH